MFTDSHCHLSAPEYRDHLPEVLHAMAQAQVGRALCIATRLDDFEAVHALVSSQPHLWASVGVHPEEVEAAQPSVADLVDRAGRARVVAVGETGLDYFRVEQDPSTLDWQRERFRTHIRAAQQVRKPLIIHTRNAAADTLAILRDEGESGAHAVGGVFHCFTETLDVAREVLDLGYHISLSGIVTFKNAHTVHEVAAYVPLDRLLIETDSPYLAPVPHRGQTNSPAWVPLVAQRIATLRGMDVQALGAATTANFLRLFGLQGAACSA